MDNEQLQKGKDLKERIDSLEQQKRIWENAKKVAISVSWEYQKNNVTTDNVLGSLVNFEVLQTLTLDTINKKLVEVKTEYAKL